MKDTVQNTIYWIFILVIFAISLFVAQDFMLRQGGAYAHIRTGDSFGVIRIWLFVFFCATIPTSAVLIARWLGFKWAGVISSVPIYFLSALLSSKFYSTFHAELYGKTNGFVVDVQAELHGAILKLGYMLVFFTALSLAVYFAIKMFFYVKSKA